MLHTQTLLSQTDTVLTHAQTLLLCENLQPKNAATGGTTDQSDQLRPTTVPAHVSLNRGHRDSEPASAVNGVSTSPVACDSLSAGIVVDAPPNYNEPSHTQYESSVLSQLRTEYPPSSSAGSVKDQCLREDQLPLSCDLMSPWGMDWVQHSALPQTSGGRLGW